MIPSAELTAARPRRQAIVEILCGDGRTLRHHARVVRGTPDDPMTRSEVVSKARDLMDPVLGTSRTSEVIAATESIERTDCRKFAALLAA